MKETEYTYTFPLDSGAICYSIPFKLEIGTKLDYWGRSWIVEAAYNDDNGMPSDDFYCKEVKDDK